MVDKVLDPFKKEAKRKNIDFTTFTENPSKRAISVPIYPVVLAISNLLENALFYTHKGFVKLFIRVKDFGNGEGTLEIEVSDSGEGIAEESKDNLFKKQAAIFLGNRIGSGAKIGLYLTKQVLEKMGGSIEY